MGRQRIQLNDPLLSTHARQPRFWTDLSMWLADGRDPLPGEPYADLHEKEIEFRIGDAGSFLLYIWGADSPDLMSLSLLAGDGGEAIQIGWWDLQHWHPDVFRWPELLCVARASVAHLEPGVEMDLPLLLLHWFLAVDVSTDVEAVRDRIASSFRHFGVPEADVRRLIDLRLGAENPIGTWTEDPHLGWVLDCPDCYSLRVVGDDDFPFELMRNVLAAAATTR